MLFWALIFNGHATFSTSKPRVTIRSIDDGLGYVKLGANNG